MTIEQALEIFDNLRSGPEEVETPARLIIRMQCDADERTKTTESAGKH